MSALGFPLAYLVWTVIHGAATGWYPYPFVDVAELGYARAAVNTAGLVLAFLALEMALVGIGRLLAHRGERGLSPQRATQRATSPRSSRPEYRW